jgi:hypothetical protein
MRIYVDFDDVLCETALALSALAWTLFRRDVPYARIHAFDLQVSFDLDDSQLATLMAQAHEPDFLLSLAPTNGGCDCLLAWMRAGHDVVIVTGRPTASHAPTRAWLARNRLGDVPVLYVDKYGRHHDAPPDAPKALSLETLRREHHFDLAIDDSPVALDALRLRAEGRTVVFDRPWNRNYTPEDSRLVRCLDWSSLDRLVREENRR